MATAVDHRQPYKGDRGLIYKEADLPPVSEAQRRAMFAAKAGHSTLGIPESVGKEFAAADPGGKLPEKSKDRKISRDMNPIDWKSLFTGFGSLMKFFREEQAEPEHAQDDNLLSPESVDYSPGIGEKVCGNCVHYIVEKDGAPTSLCEIVAGDIDPEYWCKRFLASQTRPAQDDEPKGRAASVAFVTPDGRALLVRRSADEENYPSHWGFPGGQCEEGEAEDDAARREAYEEVGDCSFDGMRPAGKQRTEHGWDHTTFTVPVQQSFVPRLNGEHDDWCWAHPDECPEPMHPKVAEFLNGFGGKVEDSEKLSETTREDIGTPGSSKREDMPEGVFLGPDRTYPVKEQRDGKWAYTRKLLEAAASEARMHGKADIAQRADAIRAREFGGTAKTTEDENLAQGFNRSREGGDLEDPARRARVMNMSRTVTKELENIKKGGAGRTWSTGSAQDGKYLALDRSSARTYDTNGYMHVGANPISKATVNDYYGREINAAMQGTDGWVPLDENKKYGLLRHPDELAAAAPTFNKLPILKRHVAISAKDFDPKLIIGSTGDAAKFDGKYLGNTLAFWDKGAIDDIENDDRKELSSAYSYLADMTPGEYEGMPYDGIMRNIKGNHLALVKAGRAGPDVMVNDADPDLEESTYMSKISKKALLRARVIKRLAVDSTPEELAELIEATREDDDGDDLDPNGGVPTGAEFGDSRRKRLMDALADCEGMDSRHAKRIMDAYDARDEESKAEHEENEAEELERVAGEERREAEEARDRLRRAADARRRLGRDETAEEEDRRERSEDAARRLGRDESEEEREERERAEAEERDRRAEDARKRLGRDEAPEELKERLESCRAEDRKRYAADARKRADDTHRQALDTRKPARDRRRAKDEPPAFPGKPEVGGKMSKEAMDKAARLAADEAVEKERTNQREIRKAEQFVRPWVGELAMDSEPDSANDVLRAALDYCGVSTKGMHPDAYRAVLEAQPRLRVREEKEMRVAADAKGGAGFGERYPDLPAIGHV